MKFRIFAVVLIALSLAPLTAVRAQEESATARVKTVLDKAMDIQTQEGLKGEAHSKERAVQIRKLISENFLPEDMAKDALKGQWEKLSQGQRNEFQGLFTKLFQDSYTRMVLNFLERESIEYGEETPKEDGVQVPTVLMRANEHIPVNYYLMKKNGRWFIRDVEIDGVSVVENYRNTFLKVIQTGSFDALIKKMRLQSQAIGGDA